MPDLYTILDNILEYRNDIDSLARQLKATGINSLEEFKQAAINFGVNPPEFIMTAFAKKIVALETADAEWENINKSNSEDVARFLLNNPDSRYRDEAERIIWNAVDKTNLDELSQYTSRFPDSSFISEANRILRDLRREIYLGVDIKALEKQMKDIQTDKRINNPEKAIYDRIVSYLNSGKIKIDDLMQALREDHNFISSTVANLLWENDIITIEDFMKAGVTEDVLKYMLFYQKSWAFHTPSAPLTKVSKSPCTEVYFWGLPSSGKEMIIAAALSEANEHYHMEKDNECQGYSQLSRLSHLLKDSCLTTLPFNMPYGSTEMGFNLCPNENKIPITFIEFSPWLVFQIRKNESLVPLNDYDSRILQELNDVMINNRTQNSKLHFFVIEYGAEDRLFYDGLPQQDYLQAAVEYIQRTGIFKKDTDGVYIIISKVDKANVLGRELKEKLKEYVLANYHAFYNSLRKICRDNEINGGEVEIIPFSLGETWLQDLVKYDNTASSRLLDLIVEQCHYRIYPSMFQRIINKFRRHI